MNENKDIEQEFNLVAGKILELQLDIADNPTRYIVRLMLMEKLIEKIITYIESDLGDYLFTHVTREDTKKFVDMITENVNVDGLIIHKKE